MPNLVELTEVRAKLETRVPVACKARAKARVNKRSIQKLQARGSENIEKIINRQDRQDERAICTVDLLKNMNLETPAAFSWDQLFRPVSPMMFMQAVSIQHCCHKFKARASTRK